MSTPAPDLALWVAIWFVVAAIVVVRHWRNDMGVGLLLAYILSFGMLHWVASAIYLFPWFTAAGEPWTAEGMRVAAVSMMGFAVGTELMFVAERRRRTVEAFEAEQLALEEEAAAPSVRPDEDDWYESDGRLASEHLIKWYLIIGLVLFVVVTPILGAIPSVSALVSAGGTLTIAAVGLKCWNLWVEERRGRMWVWLLSTAILPVVTVLTQGFLGYGFVAMLAIASFVAAFYRPRWRVLALACVLAYVGLSVYVTYMKHRQDIRAVVWTDGAAEQRFDRVTRAIEEGEWFDPTSQPQLDSINARLNQSTLR